MSPLRSATSALEASQIRELHADLEAIRDRLRDFLDGSVAASRPVDLDEPIGRLSRMDAMQQQSMARANRTAAEQRLQRVEAALRRLSDDTYGDCLRCDEPVVFERLEVQPEATLCIECQSERESS